MRCERAQELFSEYHEGSIQAAMRIPLEGHLHTCASCREDMAGLRHVWNALDTAPVVEPPADFRAMVWMRIEADAAARSRSRRKLISLDWRSLFTRPALAWTAAAALVVFLSGAVVPGVYTPAKMWFPWSLFSEAAPVQSRNVTIGQARVVADPNGSMLKIPVANPSANPIQVVIDVRGGVVAQNHIALTVPARYNGLVPVTQVFRTDSANPLKVETHWTPADQ